MNPIPRFMPLILLACIALFPKSFSKYAASCENEGTTTITCTAGVIYINSVRYTANDLGACKNPQGPGCMGSEDVPTYYTLFQCAEKSSCVVDGSNSVLLTPTDPCPQSRKALSINYDCVDYNDLLNGVFRVVS